MKSISAVHRLLVIALLVLAAAPAVVRAEGPLEQRARKLTARRYAGMAVSLPVSAFANGLKVCARETPSGILGYWKVPANVMDRVDADLLQYLRKTGADARLSIPPKLYVRQYAGFVHDGKRFIYVNALLIDKGSPKVEEAKKQFPASCAGLSGTWGIQYDTTTKQFVGFTKA